MSSFHHTPYQDGTTEYKAEDMNTPLGELDAVIHDMSGELQTQVHVFHTRLSGETSAHQDDEIAIWDDSAGVYRKMTRGDFVGSTGQTPYDIGLFYPSLPTDGLEILRFPFPRTVEFDYDISGSQAVAATASTGSVYFSFKKDGNEFARCTFNASATGSFSGESTIFVTGEVLTVVAPATADATLADIGFSIVGVRL